MNLASAWSPRSVERTKDDPFTCAHVRLVLLDRRRRILSGDVGLSYGAVTGLVMGLEEVANTCSMKGLLDLPTSWCFCARTCHLRTLLASRTDLRYSCRLHHSGFLSSPKSPTDIAKVSFQCPPALNLNHSYILNDSLQPCNQSRTILKYTVVATLDGEDEQAFGAMRISGISSRLRGKNIPLRSKTTSKIEAIFLVLHPDRDIQF